MAHKIIGFQKLLPPHKTAARRLLVIFVVASLVNVPPSLLLALVPLLTSKMTMESAEIINLEA